MPGPTLVVSPGDVLVISLVNELEEDTKGPENAFGSANTTNLHLHGMHLSPLEGNLIS